MRQCDQIERFVLVTSEAPGFPEVAAVLEAVDFVPVMRHTLAEPVGETANMAQALQRAFALSDWAVVLEASVAPAPDFLNFALWGLRTFCGDPTVAAICGHPPEAALAAAPDRQRLGMARRAHWFSPLGWATWKDRWETFFYHCLDLRLAQRPWDCFFNYNYLLARRERVCLYPEVGRTQSAAEPAPAASGDRPAPDWNAGGYYGLARPDDFRLVE